jgi:DNA-binding transcriptional MocR family regulator
VPSIYCIDTNNVKCFIVIMTIWKPRLAPDGPRYRALADAIAADIDSGRLVAGQRLPTHRDLAEELGVTIQTVSRGYAEAKQRGLVSGEVGRGTFVRVAPPEQSWAHSMRRPDPDTVDLSANIPDVTATAPLFAPAIEALANADNLASALSYQPRAGHPEHRRAAASWINRAGLDVAPDDVMITVGTQHGLALSLAALTEPGDVLLTEAVTYPGIKALARFLRLRLVGVAMDDHGMRADALSAACENERPKAVYCVPTLQNPTATVMPLKRRREIARVCNTQRLALIEDDIYRFLLDEPPPPIGSFCKADAFYLTGLSKDLAPGLRIGFLAAPSAQLEPLCGAMAATTLVASPLCAEIATRVIDDGTADRIVAERRRECRKRQALLHGILAPFMAPGSHPHAFHSWLRLPDPWRAEEFAAKARQTQVLVTSSEAFVVGRAAAPHAVRTSIAFCADLTRLERGCRVLRGLLANPPAPTLAGL